jgi:MerR family copper efflux transcriptional regulator
MRINEVEQLVGISKKNIRFYEEEGLLHPSREEGNSYRSYSESDVRTLQIIKLLRRLGVPIEEIRRVESGEIALSDCLNNHLTTLGGKIQSLNQTVALCRTMAERGETLDTLDLPRYNREMAEAEQGGVRFMSVKGDQKMKKRIAPLIWAVVFVALFSGILALVLWGSTADHTPWPVVAVIAIILLGLIVGVILALVQRMKEIEGGEEDEALQY